MKKYLMLALCAVFSVGLVTGCESKKENKNGSSVCQGCVFSYSENMMIYDENNSYDWERTKLEDYTKDYTTLKDNNGEQRKYFLGYILDDAGKVKRGFTCGIRNNELFCVEGTMDGSKYDSNVNSIKKLYKDTQCNQYDSYFSCEENEFVDVNVYIYKDGNVVIEKGLSQYDYCYVTPGGVMQCFGRK